MGITHLSGLEVAGVPTMGVGGVPLFTGNWYFVDAINGSDGNTGAADNPLATIYAAYAKMISGNNDVCIIVGNGSTTGTQRLSVANAQTITPSAAAGTITWAKNACHLIGMTAPTGVSNRARFAPPTGTYTAATFGSVINNAVTYNGTFFLVTGQGCYFSNFSLFNGFSTGSATNQVCWIDAGGRNFYNCVDFEGAGDTASAQSTSSRSLLLAGNTGENTFVRCTIGTDTVTKTVANASLELSGGSPRNKFIECDFPVNTSSATTLSVITAAAAAIDRWTKFDRCCFLNTVGSTSTTMTAAFSMAASSGGLFLLKDCTAVGVTDWGTASAKSQLYIDGPAPSTTLTGYSVNPA